MGWVVIRIFLTGFLGAQLTVLTLLAKCHACMFHGLFYIKLYLRYHFLYTLLSTHSLILSTAMHTLVVYRTRTVQNWLCGWLDHRWNYTVP